MPVPASPDRVRERGYDQAALLAAEAARRLRLPWSRALERTRATTAQFDLDRAGRASNLGGAFRVADGVAVAGRWIVLVDDVVTTGRDARRVRRSRCIEAGASAVSAVTVARER